MVRGDDLIAANFPLVHAVGRAAAEEPRHRRLLLGARGAPKVTLVGKGVIFDTGGLDIKPASGMELMKKDMGGAATALALAGWSWRPDSICACGSLMPIVENAISAPAMRPGDVIVSRKGLTIEIGNTDAEGRLILADALALAAEDAPDLILDFATLTGAARVALGPDLPPFYTDDDALAARSPITRRAPRSRLAHAALAPYDAMIERTVADVNNSARAPAWPARSPRRCSCGGSSRGASPGRISTSSPGTRSRAPTGRRAARSRRRGLCSTS